MLQADYRIDKRQIANSFAEAASRYDTYAVLQREVADSLLTQLQRDETVTQVLDLGSGTGYCTGKLQKLFPNAQIVSLDIAAGMLEYARQQHLQNTCNKSFVCGDAESLPFVTGSFDLVFSSLAIQWCQNFPALFAELKRSLKPGGSLAIATFGPGTLQELEQAWLQIDDTIHVNHFHSDRTLQESLNINAFQQIKLNSETRIRYYPGLASLKQELKSIGARNMNAGRLRGLSGRKKIQKLKELFEKNTEVPAGIPVTWQLQFVQARS